MGHLKDTLYIFRKIRFFKKLLNTISAILFVEKYIYIPLGTFRWLTKNLVEVIFSEFGTIIRYLILISNNIVGPVKQKIGPPHRNFYVLFFGFSIKSTSGFRGYSRLKIIGRHYFCRTSQIIRVS